MSTGVSLPVRCLNGRVVLDSGAVENAKIIKLCMGDGENSNPFNNVGIAHPLFAVMNGGSAALIQRAIEKHFDRLEKDNRAKLESLKLLDNDSAEASVEVEYIDLETDEAKEVVKSLGGTT